MFFIYISRSSELTCILSTYVCSYVVGLNCKHMCSCIFQPITPGDITGYQVYYNGTLKDVNSSTSTLTFTAPSLSDGVFSGTVVVMVTAVNRFGVGPASDPAIAIINGMYIQDMYIQYNNYTTVTA